MAEEVGVEYGRAMAAVGSSRARDGQRSFRAALHAVADALTAHGFAAHTEKRGNELRIVYEALPVRRRRHRAPGHLRGRPRAWSRACSATLYGDTDRRRSRRCPWATTSASPLFEPSPAVDPCATTSTTPPPPRRARRRSRRCRPGCGGAVAGDPARIHTEGHASRVAVEDGARPGRGAARCPPPRGGVHQRGDRGDRARGLRARPSGAITWSSPAVEHSAVRLASASGTRSRSSAATPSGASTPPT